MSAPNCWFPSKRATRPERVAFQRADRADASHRMSKWGQVVQKSDGRVLATSVRWCASLFCKGRGLMLRRSLKPGEGLLFVESFASRAGTAVTMLFMRFPIAVIWMDADFKVVDKLVAKPWRLSYVPTKAAKYYLEAEPELVQHVNLGDELEFLVAEIND